jgi:hypothetical protein
VHAPAREEQLTVRDSQYATAACAQGRLAYSCCSCSVGGVVVSVACWLEERQDVVAAASVLSLLVACHMPAWTGCDSSKCQSVLGTVYCVPWTLSSMGWSSYMQRVSLARWMCMESVSSYKYCILTSGVEPRCCWKPCQVAGADTRASPGMSLVRLLNSCKVNERRSTW